MHHLGHFCLTDFHETRQEYVNHYEHESLINGKIQNFAMILHSEILNFSVKGSLFPKTDSCLDFGSFGQILESIT